MSGSKHDQSLRNKVESLDQRPVAGWNPESAWADIDAALNPGKKRPVAWWWAAAVGLLLIGSVTWWQQSQPVGGQLAKSVSQPELGVPSQMVSKENPIHAPLTEEWPDSVTESSSPETDLAHTQTPKPELIQPLVIPVEAIQTAPQMAQLRTREPVVFSDIKPTSTIWAVSPNASRDKRASRAPAGSGLAVQFRGGGRASTPATSSGKQGPKLRWLGSPLSLKKTGKSEPEKASWTINVNL